MADEIQTFLSEAKKNRLSAIGQSTLSDEGIVKNNVESSKREWMSEREHDIVPVTASKMDFVFRTLHFYHVTILNADVVSVWDNVAAFVDKQMSQQKVSSQTYIISTLKDWEYPHLLHHSEHNLYVSGRNYSWLGHVHLLSEKTGHGKLQIHSDPEACLCCVWKVCSHSRLDAQQTLHIRSVVSDWYHMSRN